MSKEKEEEVIELTDVVVVEFDKYGFMTNFRKWNKDLAIYLAQKERVDKLTEKDWQAIMFVRRFYQEQGRAPWSPEIAQAVGIEMKDYTSELSFRTDALIKIAGLSRLETRAS
jgi:TusE/DsrC/DsvC family sulfur relay protein